MAKRIKFCTRCMTIIRKNDERCSNCGLEVSKMIEETIKKEEQNQEEIEKVVEKKLEEYEQPKVEEVKVEETAKVEDVQTHESNDNVEQVKAEQPAKRKRHKHKPKQVSYEDRPQFTIDENGQFNIDTSDVTYLEGVDTKSYSVKKARGEAPVQEKLKWWEIYKWADRVLARRKINKEVNKASHKIPFAIHKAPMLIYAILFGWMGAHNFYAGNYKRGWTVLAFDVVVAVVLNVPVLYEIMGVFVGGGLGFVILCMWLKDIFNIVIDKYRYRISKEEFISNLNIETRAKLGKKYITFDRKAFKEKEEKRLKRYIKKQTKKKLKADKKKNEA